MFKATIWIQLKVSFSDKPRQALQDHGLDWLQMGCPRLQLSIHLQTVTLAQVVVMVWRS